MQFWPEGLKIAPWVAPDPKEADADFLARLKCFYIQHADTSCRTLLAMTEPQTARGSIFFSPGRTEFVEKYFEMAQDMTARGYFVCIIEPRGQGLSPRLLDNPYICHVESFQDYAADFARTVQQFAPCLPRPHILMGHSMGSTVVLQAVLLELISASALICCSPMLRVQKLQQPVMIGLIRLLSQIGFRRKRLFFQPQKNGMPLDFEANLLTSDARRYERWVNFFVRAPALRLGTPSLGWMCTALQAMAFVRQNAKKLNLSTLILGSGADEIVDNKAVYDFAAHSGAQLYMVPEAAHELFMEQDIFRQSTLERIDDFLESLN